ncbi:stage IV sporulation protein FA [Scopulibacillus daqui]|uniref:Stage IV sporulation protein FA n=1 Tax=Scopulibacillus daqui TaxID=1469162 RepID=A0ABS2PXH1_9BACL|nr:M23 family metallopeptidase [Scopulibacillus daqui]MBM7644716.1 stage IV sporulation protein FA [Scopulibacillus daqui]
MKRIDEIRKRHKDRKKSYERPKKHAAFQSNHKSPDHFSEYSGFQTDNGQNEWHPLFRIQTFIIKCLIAGCLVLGTGIVYKQSNGHLATIKDGVSKAMNDDFKFAEVSGWYEDTFGKPLALLPFMDQSKQHKDQSKSGKMAYAEPVSGQVTKKFSAASKGVLVKTSANSQVKAVKDGFVVFVGKKDKTGETVIIQHKDGSESWYGKLDNVNVKTYDFVKRGQKVGTVSKGDHNQKGTFYFALKEGNHFIDPIQVISFE